MNAIWAGFLHFENTRIAIELFPATTKSSSFLQHVHSECHANLQRSLTCPEHGIVNKAEQTLTYNMPDGDQIIIEPDELAAIRTEKSKRMTLRHFIPKASLIRLILSVPILPARGAVTGIIIMCCAKRCATQACMESAI